MSATKTGTLIALVGSLLIFVGLFGMLGRCARPDVPCPSPSLGEVSAYGGLLVLVFAVFILVRSGLRGNFSSAALGAVAALPATWTLYEVVRQGVPLPGIGVLDEMTAPALSAAVALAIVVVGAMRHLRSRDIARR